LAARCGQRAYQDARKSARTPLNTLPKRLQQGPRRCQDASRMLQDASWSIFGVLSIQNDYFGCWILVSLYELLVLRFGSQVGIMLATLSATCGSVGESFGSNMRGTVRVHHPSYYTGTYFLGLLLNIFWKSLVTFALQCHWFLQHSKYLIYFTNSHWFYIYFAPFGESATLFFECVFASFFIWLWWILFITVLNSLIVPLYFQFSCFAFIL